MIDEFNLFVNLQKLRGGHSKVGYSLPFDKLRTGGSMVLPDSPGTLWVWAPGFSFCPRRAQNEKRQKDKVPRFLPRLPSLTRGVELGNRPTKGCRGLKTLTA